jgi:glycosyltransferase involved in cell wall biosynthesis
MTGGVTGSPAPRSRVRARAPHVLLAVENVALARDHRLQKQVSSLLAHGFRVTVVCRSDPQNGAFAGAGARLCTYRAPADAASKLGFIREYGYSFVMAGWLAARVFLTDRFDALQVSGTPDIYFALAAPFKLFGRPLVLDQRDLSPELYELRYGRRGGAMYRTLCWLERMSYRAADHVVTVNSSLEKVAYARGGLLPGTVTVVGNGPSLARSYRRPAQPALKNGRRFLCCWLGLMGPQDRLDVALRSISHLIHVIGRTDCHFSFVGDGEARAPSRQLAAELGISEWVTFPGWADQEEAYTYLSTADLGLEPNLEEIVSPVKGMEYMAFGLPFVSFDLTETRALAEGAAAWAPPGDIPAFARQIDELLGDPARRAEMGQTGRRLIMERLAWDRQEDAYIGVYQRLLGRPPSPERAANQNLSARRLDHMATEAHITVAHRARHRLRTRVSELPGLYLPFARRKYPGPSPEVISSETQLVIDGYTRSASTFAVYALQLAQPSPVRLAHHLHAPAQLIEAARTGIPALAVIRVPEGAVLSQLIREPDVALRDAMIAYARFYECLLPYRDKLVVADFEEVTKDLGAVIRRINARFGTAFCEFEPSETNVRRCFDLIKLRSTLFPALLGFESGTVTAEQLEPQIAELAQRQGPAPEAWIPSPEREHLKAALRAQWTRPELARLRERANRVYDTFRATE